MRLERLEINGFKSFSDRSELAFDKGVTAIVGPNGCGKSNVADAITWVMGEQSAKSLRGDKMEDVIFSGSDARKPTAAAEVRLRFSGVLKTLAGPAFPDDARTANGNGNGHGHSNGHGNGRHATDGHTGPSLQSIVEGNGAIVGAGSSVGLRDLHVGPNGDAATVGSDLGVGPSDLRVGANGDAATVGADLGVGPGDLRVGANGDVATVGADLGVGPGDLHVGANGDVATVGADLRVGPQVFTRTEAEVIIQSVAREVEVTRRLYRSGESEYLIDGQVCRLRDVHDLLMDTGLGAKAYAIIEQGKIGLILSSRPTDRRQLIEEAAGVTKYKARRRSAELKLEAAQQNLTRIDDIVFEVEKQRGTLKRQAGKARRYQRLRDELRRFEKVLFARKYRQLAETIESARARLASARERESAAAARVAAVESDFGRVRIELAEAEAHATQSREAAHARELAIARQQQQIAFDREQTGALDTRTAMVSAELGALESRREPARLAIEARRQAAAAAMVERDRASETLASESEAYDVAHCEIEGLEADVEAARSEVFSALNSATALRHALEHAAAARDRVAESLSKLDVEDGDVRIESERVEGDRAAAADGLRRAHDAIEATRLTRSARESELASARIEHDWRARSVRAREHELAGIDARLTSLEELEAARANYGDASRAVLAQANGQVSQQGAIADYLDVERGYERAVEACLGDLLQHVVVERPEHAAAGFQLVRDAGAGRCGFLVTSAVPPVGPMGADASTGVEPASAIDGVVALSSLVRVNGPFAGAIRQAIGDAWIADSYDRAAGASGLTALPVATIAGELFRGPSLVSGGSSEAARGILETKREIRELRDRLQTEREALARLAQETADLEAAIAHATNAIGALNAEHHKQEKAIVGHESQLQHAADEAARLAQKRDQLARERRQAEDEREALDRRQEEARASIVRLDEEQRLADERLTSAQRRLFEAREATEELSRRAAEARAAHAALVERASALAADVDRLQDAAAELEARAASLTTELDETRRRIDRLREAIASGEAQLDADVRALERARETVQQAEEAAATLRAQADQHELAIKDARAAYESIRSGVSELDIARATAEADLSHLAASCIDAVQATLDEVVVEVDAQDQRGDGLPDAEIILAEETDDDAAVSQEPSVVSQTEDSRPPTDDSTTRTMSAEAAIARLREKIDRLGPVNMMAIEQFDELESRHAFLTTQRVDLVESIAQTSEAIKRIDETTRQRFAEAFAAINTNFQSTFSTLFGGGRAGLTLLDESDPLESGIEIIAQPPGKRLQSVQLLSGGEKALTAIALMFGLFKYKPSPFCLLDEIDAPLDDANIGRFVEMLRSMQRDTQFILITHSRKTMEIADRLYGVTMEEPGVSKLISVQLN